MLVLKRSPTFESLIAELNKLPGIGRKSAERIAYHFIKSSQEDVLALTKAIKAVKDNIISCSTCFNLAETNPCPICADSARNNGQILVVEDAMDIASFERAGVYHGRYHVLQGRIVPLKGITPEHLRIRELVERVKGGSIKEVILATDPDVEGDATALYISRLLSPLGVEITRIGLGIPMGGSLEYTDSITLEKALEGRKRF